MKRQARQLGALARLAVLELYRRKDLAVVLVLSAVILVPLSMFDPFGIPGASRHVNEIALLALWLFSGIITLGVSTRLFPPEFDNRTVYPMLAKPVGRGTIIVGKYLGAAAASLSALLAFYLAYGVLAGLKGGGWFPPVLLQAVVLHAGFVALVAALGLAGSLLLTPSANWTFCGLTVVGMLLFGQRLPQLAAAQTGAGRWVLLAIHALAPHVEFFDLRQRVVHVWPPVGWGVCAAVWAYAVAYAALCLAGAAWLFRRRRL